MNSELIEFFKGITEENRRLSNDLIIKNEEIMNLKRVNGQLEGINRFLEFRLGEAERRIIQLENQK